jgi:peptide/nickel transport system permease protein
VIQTNKVEIPHRSPRQHWLGLTRGWRRAVILGALLGGIFLVAVSAPVISPQDPFKVSVRDRLKPPGFVSDTDRLFILGTDGVGRDILSRVLLGSQTSLLISVCAVAIAAVTGSAIGLVIGFVRGRAETVVMRIADIWLAFPEILLALSVMAVLGASVTNLIIALGFSRWVSYLRLVRGNVLAVREREYVTAARVIGAPSWRIMVRHILPNTLDVIVILAALHLGQMIILESALSFLTDLSAQCLVGSDIPWLGHCLHRADRRLVRRCVAGRAGSPFSDGLRPEA